MGILTTNTKSGLASALGSRTGAQELESLLVPHSLAKFNPVDDGTTANDAAFTAAIAELSDGDTLFIPRTAVGYAVSSPIVINKAISIVGLGNYPVIKQKTANTALFTVTASGVTFENLDLRCYNATATYEANTSVIYAYGSNYQTYLNNIRVRDCKIRNASFGVYLKYVTDFDISHNWIDNISYAGIHAMSVNYGVIHGNKISNIIDTANFPYGIAVSQLSTPDVRSTDVVISSNVVDTCPWEGIDTHGGKRITIANNTVRNCLRGIVATIESGGSPRYAPEQVTISGNTCESSSIAGLASEGILVNGVLGSPQSSSPTPATEITVVGNTVKGHGTHTTIFSGGFYAHSTIGLVVMGNTFTNCSPHGIVLDPTNYGFTIGLNTVKDCWSSATSACCLLIAYGDYNKGVVANNSMVSGGLAALFTGTADSGSTTTIVKAGAGFTQATVGQPVRITAGTQSGQYSYVASATSTTLTVSPAFPGAIDGTSVYCVGPAFIRTCGERAHASNQDIQLGINYHELTGGGVDVVDVSTQFRHTLDAKKYGWFSTAATAQSTGWTAFSNVTPDKTADAAASSTAELANILGTLLVELRAKGIIST